MDQPHEMVDFLKSEIALLGVTDPQTSEFTPFFSSILGRRLRPSDPTRSAGVAALDWIPRENTQAQHEPLLGTYLYIVESFVKNTSEEEGGKAHTILAKKIRNMLYRDDGFRVRLTGAPSTPVQGIVERVQRWGVRQQRFQANELEGKFLFLSITEFWVEVESTAL